MPWASQQNLIAASKVVVHSHTHAWTINLTSSDISSRVCSIENKLMNHFKTLRRLRWAVKDLEVISRHGLLDFDDTSNTTFDCWTPDCLRTRWHVNPINFVSIVFFTTSHIAKILADNYLRTADFVLSAYSSVVFLFVFSGFVFVVFLVCEFLCVFLVYLLPY